jgi:hypothetical protein
MNLTKLCILKLFYTHHKIFILMFLMLKLIINPFMIGVLMNSVKNFEEEFFDWYLMLAIWS